VHLEVRDDLAIALERRLGLRTEVRLYPPGTLPRTEVGKAVRQVTWTEGPAPIPDLDDPDG
jgi:phenylacetate-CoA ligase